MKLRFLAILMALAMVLGMVPGAYATEATEETKPVRGEFECGDDLVWAYDDGVLTITGTSEMDDYEGDAPWAAYKDKIESVILTGGVTYIGARAFRNYSKLKSVDFGTKLREIGEEAFYSCVALTEIELPATHKIFGPSSFENCKGLVKIHCNGVFPSFRLNCMLGTYATIYYPADRPWKVSLIEELEAAFHGRIEFLASDGTDHYSLEETAATETTEVTEVTEVTTEVTEAPTEIPTSVPTEVPTEVTEETVETTVPATTAPETQVPTQATQPPTEPVVEENNGENDLVPVVMGVGAAIVLLLVITVVIVLRKPKKGGKYAK